MDDRGEIVSSFDVDDNVALQIWTKGRSPRLVVFNKGRGSRKLIQLGWIEKRDRKLSISGQKRGQSRAYSIEDFVPGLQRILSEYAVYTNFRIRLWKFAVEFEKVLHAPEIVTDRGEMNLLSEEKRSSLWIADFTEDRKQGSLRPFFPVTAGEAGVLDPEAMKITDAERNVEPLVRRGFIRALAKAAPARWHNPVRVTAAALLLGFSYCGADGLEFADSLWEGRAGDAQPALDFSLRDPRLMGLGRKLAAFIRHFNAVERIEEAVSLDSDKELQDQGYVRKRRLAFAPGTIGDVPYKVTFFEDEAGGRTAFGCKPDAAPSRERWELIYSLPTEDYHAALRHDTMGGPDDEYFTVTQLAWARQFLDWNASVAPYVGSFAGLM